MPNNIDQQTFDQQYGNVSQSDFDSKYGTGTSSDIYKGSLADQFFKGTASGRVLSAFGQGYHQDWGAQNFDLDQMIKDYVNKSPDLKQWIDNHKEIAKGVNENLIRPWAHLADTAAWGLSKLGQSGEAVMSGINSAVGQVGEELKNDAAETQSNPNTPSWSVAKVLSQVEGGIGEAIQSTLPTPFDTSDPTNKASSFLLPEFGLPERAATARAHGIIGEGEEGYFGTREVRPEHLEERNQAATEAGITPPKVEQPTFDINALARDIDPDTFKKYDQLREREENLRLSREYVSGQLNTEGLTYKDQVRLQKTLDNIHADLITNQAGFQDIAEDLAKARSQVTEGLESQGQYGDMYRDYVQRKMFEIQIERDGLLTDAEIAKDHALSLLPSDKEILEAQKGSGDKIESTTVPSSTESGETSSVAPKEAVPSPTDTVKQGLPQTKGTGDLQTPRLSGHVEADALAKELTSGFGDQPMFRSLNMQYQADETAKIFATNPEYGIDVALGRAVPPEDVHPLAIYLGAEKYAHATGDVELLRQLAVGSPIPREVSSAAQTLRVAGERESLSAVKGIEEVNEARKKASVGGRSLSKETMDVANEVEQYIDRVASGKSAWAELIKMLECK